MVLGVALDYVGLDAVKMLFWSAVANGVLAPPLIVLVVLLTSDRKVMGDRVNPPLLKWMGWLAAVVMTARRPRHVPGTVELTLCHVSYPYSHHR